MRPGAEFLLRTNGASIWVGFANDLREDAKARKSHLAAFHLRILLEKNLEQVKIEGTEKNQDFPSLCFLRGLLLISVLVPLLLSVCICG